MCEHLQCLCLGAGMHAMSMPFFPPIQIHTYPLQSPTPRREPAYCACQELGHPADVHTYLRLSGWMGPRQARGAWSSFSRDACRFHYIHNQPRLYQGGWTVGYYHQRSRSRCTVVK